MAEKEKTLKDWLRIILPRVLRAAFWGFIMGGEFLILLYVLNIGEQLQSFLPIEQFGFSSLLFVFVGFEVAIQLLRGTILQYALSIARALVSMVALVFMTNGGMMNFTFSSSPQIPLPSGVVITFTIDFRVIMGVFLLLSLVSIMKNLLQAIDFLSEKAEDPMVPPEFS
jgi:hypothetical protein